MKKHFLLSSALLFITLALTFSALAAKQDKVPNNPEIAYIISPSNVPTGIPATLTICLINQGGEGTFSDAAGDSVSISFPMGTGATQIIEAIEDIEYDMYSNQDWVALPLQIVGNNVVLTLIPNGSVTIPNGGVACFKIEVEVIDAEGLVILPITQELSDAIKLKKNVLHILKTTFPVDGDPDPTNELNTSVTLNGTALEVTDEGGTISSNSYTWP